MVRKNTTDTTEVRTRGKQGVNNWEDQMAADAEVAAAQEAMTGGGQFIGLASGVLSFNGTPMPNNEMHCVILDNIFENVHYEGEFDRDNPTAPRCFAFGRYDRDGKTVVGIDTHNGTTEMAPHKSVLNPVCDTCAECPMNQFGTAKYGRGKACKNMRRLALIPVLGVTKKGTFNINTTDLEHYTTSPMAYLKTPVTSAKVFGAYVTQVAGSLKRPPYGVFTKIYLTPSDNQFTVNFEAVDSIPNNMSKTIMNRVDEARAAIAFPYAMLPEDEKPIKGKGAKQDKPGKAVVKPGKAVVKPGKAVDKTKKKLY